MANWDKLTDRGDVEDRRGMAPAAIGGISLTGVALLMLFNVLMGGSPLDVLGQLQNVPIQSEQSAPAQNTSQFDGQDAYEVFASTVIGSNDAFWSAKFNQSNQEYQPPKLVLFRQATQSACGGATSAVGPHYCPLDKTIYLDETFFDELTRRFGAKGGDVAQAYVLAHEVGHHVQNELGIMEKAQNSGNKNENSVRLELQADCLAGMWAGSIKDEGVLEPNEISEAIDAAEAVGDDRIQETITGRVNPESWTHGSSEQRKTWFIRGYNATNFSTCNTFQ